MRTVLADTMRRHRHYKEKKRVQRDTSVISKLGKLLYDHHKKDRIHDDKRRWRPDKDIRTYRTIDSRVAKINNSEIVERENRPPYIRNILVFDDSRRVVVCKRRADRRISLFARHKVGKGKKVSKRRLRSPDSEIHCKHK